jgi:hypothetical protein
MRKGVTWGPPAERTFGALAPLGAFVVVALPLWAGGFAVLLDTLFPFVALVLVFVAMVVRAGNPGPS